MNKERLDRLKSIRNDLTVQIDAMRVLVESDSARSIDTGALLTVLAASLGKSMAMINETDEMFIDIEETLAKHKINQRKLAEIKRIIETNVKSIFTSFVFNFDYNDGCNLSDFVKLKELLEISRSRTDMSQARCFDNNRKHRTKLYTEIIEKTTGMIIEQASNSGITESSKLDNILLRTLFLNIASDLIHHASPLSKDEPTISEVKDFIKYIENFQFSCG